MKDAYSVVLYQPKGKVTEADPDKAVVEYADYIADLVLAVEEYIKTFDLKEEDFNGGQVFFHRHKLIGQITYNGEFIPQKG